MKKILSVILLICIGLSCLPSCSTNDDGSKAAGNSDSVATGETASPEETASPGAETDSRFADKSKKYRILFIGNSFTEYNNMPRRLFEPICKKAGYTVVVDAVTRGSYILESFANASDAYGERVDRYLREKEYDAVIIQEQSHRPISDYASFERGVKALAKKVSANGADLFLYETWGYKAGHGGLPSYGGSTRKMAEKLQTAYAKAAKAVGAKVIPAGAAMLDVYTNHKSKIELYEPDLYHPSNTGSVLVAYTAFETIFGVDVRTVNYRYGTTEHNSILKEAAHNAVLG